MTEVATENPYKPCIDFLRKEVEDGLVLAQYHYFDHHTELHCAIGSLAKEVGVDEDVIKTAGMKIISCSPSVENPASQATTHIREVVTEHFDGEEPDRFMVFLEKLQEANDRSFDEPPHGPVEFRKNVFLHELDKLEEEYA